MRSGARLTSLWANYGCRNKPSDFAAFAAVLGFSPRTQGRDAVHSVKGGSRNAATD